MGADQTLETSVCQKKSQSEKATCGMGENNWNSYIS